MVQWHTSLVALQHVGSFQTRDWTPVSCIGRQIPHHRDLREAPKAPFFNQCCWWQGSYSPWYGDMTWPCQVNPCQHSSSGSDHVFSSLASAHLALSFLHLEAPTSPCWSPAYPTDGGHGLHIQQLTGTHPVTIARWVSLFFFDNKACAYCGPRAKQWIQTQTSLSSGQTRGIPLIEMRLWDLITRFPLWTYHYSLLTRTLSRESDKLSFMKMWYYIYLYIWSLSPLPGTEPLKPLNFSERGSF